MKHLLGLTLILISTLIWGSAFVAQKNAVEHYGPFTLTCYRNLLAGIFMAIIILIRNRYSPRRVDGISSRGRQPLLGGILSGVVLFLAMTTQQIGIEYTTPGISAFLTANYILIVPFLAWIIGTKRPRSTIWLGVILAIVGTYLICLPNVGENACLTIGKGELWTLLCAFFFAVQIIVVDRYATKCDVLVFSMVQLFAASLCAAPFILFASEASRLTFEHFISGWWSLFYIGIFSSGIAYTLQNMGQSRVPAVLAAIVMSFEAVVGALSGYFFLGDTLVTMQLVGCLLVFTAIVFASLTNISTE